MLDVRKLYLLQQLQVHGSMTKVAAMVGLTRPAVSRQLALLEAQAQTSLFERHGRQVRLTAAGNRLVRHLPALFATLESIHAELQAEQPQPHGELRLGGFGSSLVELVPAALQRLSSRHPGLDVHVVELESADGLRAVVGRQVDLAIVDDQTDATTAEPMLDVYSLMTDHFVAVLAAHHPLASAPSVPLAALSGESWAINQASPSFHTLIVNACRQQGFEPQIKASCRNMLATLALVRTRGLVAVLPGLALPSAPTGCRWVALEPALSRGVQVAVARGHRQRPAIAAALQALREAARHMTHRHP